MVRTILDAEKANFEWIDIVEPTIEDFGELKAKYNLHEASIKDCLQVGQLPKIEEFENYHFLIIRSIPSRFDNFSDTLTEITERVSVFFGERFVITVHRGKVDYLEKLIDNFPVNKLQSSKLFINHLTSEALKTFENLVINKLNPQLDSYEEMVFLHKRKKDFLRQLYYIKRQIDLIRIILTLYKDIVDIFHLRAFKNIYTQDLKDIYARSTTLYRNISENTAQLLSVYFNIESNHTNDIMRTLTIISVFFMPLTFIVGVYGMNFKSMPELEWYYGYPAVMIGMALLALLIYYWFKKRKWL
ncbi:CorA family divalent cation transporter [Sphingobacterium oryzagri]|uniref:CorA family divalent cation transporter n=1 Tax=Sphingobacterium oryzagri TaxID=3025669 RepID=A0ABY7WE17_9SPHI|nr:CorA family divalent cation transporter [Sphingobacterium sp. KACC 22765]WDF67896.1 CorA family divalent cation transporter [Sphingobacterium sp. KACC 22765]